MGKKKIKILGIETSCDETAASLLQIVNGKLQTISNIVSSQVKIHAQYGGIVPEVAARQHAEKIIFVLQQALKSKIINLKSIDAIAVTSGPGLITSLLIGVEATKTLSFLARKPLIPVNHLAGHIYANFVDNADIRGLERGYTRMKNISDNLRFDQRQSTLKMFPAVCLIVSGGHTELVLMNDFEKFKKIGQTLDDAAGECFDKVAKILGLGYPGGPQISAMAEISRINADLLTRTNAEGTRIHTDQINADQHKPDSRKFVNKLVKISDIQLPRPMITSGDFNFSFSGLKTAVLYKTQKIGKSQTRKLVSAICTEFQQAVIDVLIAKTIRAAKKLKARSIILGGGVVANKELRRQFDVKVQTEMSEVKLLIPELKYTTDNAVMIAAAGYFKLKKTPRTQWQKKFDWRKIKTDPNLEI